jgi:hypothetical protein
MELNTAAKEDSWRRAGQEFQSSFTIESAVEDRLAFCIHGNHLED